MWAPKSDQHMRCLMYFKAWPIDNHRKYQLQQWTSPAKIWRSMTWWLGPKGVVLLTMIIKVSVENGGNEVLYHGIWDRKLLVYLPCGKHTKSFWKSPFIVDFPMKNGDLPWFFYMFTRGYSESCSTWFGESQALKVLGDSRGSHLHLECFTSHVAVAEMGLINEEDHDKQRRTMGFWGHHMIPHF